MQDENRHGDFFASIMKVRPEYLDDWQAKLWSRFFCHSVYITMYLNDHQRSSFYEALGLNTTQFNKHVVIETNNSTARLFPAVRLLTETVCCAAANARHLHERDEPVQVPGCESAEYWERMDRLVEHSTQLIEPGRVCRCQTARAPSTGSAWTASWSSTRSCLPSAPRTRRTS